MPEITIRYNIEEVAEILAAHAAAEHGRNVAANKVRFETDLPRDEDLGGFKAAVVTLGAKPPKGTEAGIVFQHPE